MKVLLTTKRLVLLYLLLMIVFLVFKNGNSPTIFHLSVQTLFVAGVYYYLNIVKRPIRLRTFFLSIFLYNLFFAFLIRGMNTTLYGNIYGFYTHNSIESSDGYMYFLNTSRNYYLGVIDYIEKMNALGYKWDDMGIVFIYYFVLNFFGVSLTPTMMFILNFSVVAWGSVLLYKIGKAFLEPKLATLLAVLWGTMPFAPYVSVVGLKENFFALIIILFFYGLIRITQKERNRSIYFLLIMLCVFTASLFRLVFAGFLSITIVSYIILQSTLIWKYFRAFLLIAGGIGYMLYYYSVDFFYTALQYDTDTMLLGIKQSLQEAGGDKAILFNFIAGFFGPIPTFAHISATKLTYITLYSLSTFLKLFLSFFFYYQLYYTLKQKNYLILSMYIYCFLNILLVITTFYSLHDRYQWPHIPFFFLLSVMGMQTYYKHSSKKYTLYVIACLALILVFNFR